MLGCDNEKPPNGYMDRQRVLYDGITKPGKPYFNPDYNPADLTGCPAIKNGIERTNKTRKKLGPDFTRQVGENKAGVAMTKTLREKRKTIYKRALQIVGKT